MPKLLSALTTEAGGSLPSSAGDAAAVMLKPRLYANPTVQRLGSRWNRRGSGSGGYSSGSLVKAVPIDVVGLDILGVTIHVQGSLVGTVYFEAGIYDSDANGLPRNLLTKDDFQITSGGGKNFEFTTPVLASSGHNGRLWMGYAMNFASGAGVQLSHSVPTGLAALEVGTFDAGESLSLDLAGASLTSANSITGTLGSLGRTWPASFGTYGISPHEQFPNYAVRVRKPA
ncbi:hypothetical protein [Brevundimonas vesicularis]|uniref:Minor tail protein n=1 Tax=Brevundimonas vesicularis TaxID=41276 RepID=A0ABU4KPB9_BREVE|nr:hypothetical protein [Brevundimonas vesicularis]MDX2334627.1 hypothetical protein [Brevundimonas vesicularis]